MKTRPNRPFSPVLRRSALITILLLTASIMRPASAVQLVATNGTALFLFDSETPGLIAVEAIDGLRANETVVGIDYRPADGKLYAVTTAGRLGTLNIESGELTSVGPTGSIIMAGNSFGTDFNPVADRLRQVSDTEQNIRINPNDGTTANTDTALSPAGTIVATAYTNNFVGAQTTTLFAIDAVAGQLVRIGGPDGAPSPNGGQVTGIGSLGLGINLNQNIGFDIYSNATAFACITVAGEQRLYSINLSTGAATSKGQIASATNLRGLAAVLQPPAPPVTAYGVTSNGTLFRFLSTSASSATTIGNLGIVPEGLDFRPGTQELYALDVGPVTTQLYKVNTSTAAITPVGSGFNSDGGASYSLLNSTIGFDFNPRSLFGDGSMRIRVVASNGTNLRVNSNTGAIAAFDIDLAFAAGDPNSGAPLVDACAYINSAVGTAAAAGTTTLYDLSFGKDALLIQNPPNNGTLVTVGGTGVPFDANVGFDIYTDPDSTNDTIAGDSGFAVFKRTGSQTYMLYEVNLLNGQTINSRTVGGGLDFAGGFAVQPSAGKFRLAAASQSVSEGDGLGTVTVQRVNGSAGPASVMIATFLGSATAGSDYVSTSTTLNFAAGETTKNFSVPITDDAAAEGNETIGVLLSTPTNGAFLTDPSSGVINIIDNDIAGIAIQALTNGQDRDSTPGVGVRVGSTVAYEYVVTNTGNVPLAAVAVTDDNGTPGDPADDFSPAFMNGDANGNNLLDIGETWTYGASRIAVAGAFSHTASAVGTPAGGAPSVVATDPEHQFGFTPTVLANISTRLRVEAGDRLLIGGFTISAPDDKKVIIRAIGPSNNLAAALVDPALEVYNSEGGLIGQNNDWQDAPNKQEIIDSTLAPTDDREAAFLATLAPGAYTALVFGVGETTGIGLVEVYDLDSTVSSDLVNLATRGFVQTGDDVLIGGFIVTGPAQRALVLRGLGPSLTLAGKLEDPTLELFNANGDTLEFNNNWRDTQEALISQTGIPPENDAEAAVYTLLPAGNYTAVLRGANDSTGIGVVEIYDLD